MGSCSMTIYMYYIYIYILNIRLPLLPVRLRRLWRWGGLSRAIVWAMHAFILAYLLSDCRSCVVSSNMANRLLVLPTRLPLSVLHFLSLFVGFVDAIKDWRLFPHLGRAPPPNLFHNPFIRDLLGINLGEQHGEHVAK